MPLQEIIDWLGQKDEELSAQLPLRGDVLLVQQEKETHAVRSLCLPVTAGMGWGWAALPGTPASCHCPRHSLWVHQSLTVSTSASRKKAEPIWF